MPYDSGPVDYVKLLPPDKQSHKVHGYNADTLQAEKQPEDLLQLAPFLQVAAQVSQVAVVLFNAAGVEAIAQGPQ